MNPRLHIKFVDEIASMGLTPVESMNILQDAGIVSNNAVHLIDVADQDVAAARAFLQHRSPTEGLSR
jgi:hypothetical protein